MVETRSGDQEPSWRNEVVLRGRLAAPAVDRELPSGDVVTTWRLVVDRPPDRTVGGAEVRRAPTVDTLDCATWRSDVRRRVTGWSAGDVLHVEGALRRRFWRAGAAAASRYEVEAVRVRRVSRAPAVPASRPRRAAGAGVALAAAGADQ